MATPTYTLTADQITVCLEGQTHTVPKSAPNFGRLREALIHERWADVPKYLSVAQAIESWSKGEFKMTGSQIRYKDEVLPEALGERIREMVRKSEDPGMLLRFWERLRNNPSHRSVNQLFSFLSHKHIPLTEDGCFLAYKSVTADYKDHRTGTISNKVGVVNKMPRNQISDDPREACHEGFHVGALEYAQTFGGSTASKVLVCKVDPADVVCVPYDSSQQKMRVCRYEVLGHHGSELPSTVFTPEVADEDIGDDEDAIEEIEIEDIGELSVKETPRKKKSRRKDKKLKARGTKTKSKKKGKKKDKKKSKKSSPWTRYHRMSEDQLLKQSIEDLRKYAASGLKIFGASKIPGGKLALVAKITEIRGR